MQCKKSTLFSGCLLTVLVPAAFGQSGWKRVDIPGTSATPILSFQELPSGVMLAGTQSNSLFRSTDGGINWLPQPVITPNENILSMAVTKDGRLLVGTAGPNGVCISDDDGDSFTQSNAGLLTIRCSAFGIHPDSKWIYAATFGVYRSSDNGKVWAEANEGLEHRGSTCFAFDDDDAMYVGTDGGLSVSTNGGDSWNPLLSISIDTTVTSIFVSDNSIFAGTNRGGILCSTNRGETWTSFSAGLDDSSITSLVSAGDLLFAGTQSHGSYVSKIGTNKWTSIEKMLHGLRVFQFFLGNNNNLFAVTDSGLFEMSAASAVASRSPEAVHVNVLGRRVTVENIQEETITVSVFDLLGRQVVRRESRDAEIGVDLNGVAVGSYVARVTSPNESQRAISSGFYLY